MSYEVNLQQFAGPLQLLLELIEGKKLPITDVSLAQVAEDYVRHVNEHDVPAEELADFLVVASRLLLIKSQAILPLPALDEEEDATALADQLRMYKAYVDASKRLEMLYAAGRVLIAREKPLLIKVEGFHPPENADAPSLHASFLSLLKRLEPFFALKQTSMERVVSVQERIREIREVILERSRLTFNDIVGGAKSKVEVVVSFLALLELMKQRVIHAVQKESFHDITITHSE